MFAPILRRQALLATRTPAVRAFSCARFALSDKVAKVAEKLSEVDGPESLFGVGAKEGTIPTDLEQATGLERLELLGKLEGVEIFDNSVLDSSRKGTMEDPIIVDSYDDYRFVGCTGSPAGSHEVLWLKVTEDKIGRCWECGSVYKLNALHVPKDEHH